MLEYFKTILNKVSFDLLLFEKELRKSISRLLPNEVEDLKKWCYDQFNGKHQQILDKCFYSY